MMVACAVAVHVGGAAGGVRKGARQSVPPATRTYYIAADEVEWDYAPTGTNLTEGRPFNDDEKAFMVPGPTVIGRKAKKALYREYTDDTFKTLKPRPPEWEHLGFLGPVIRAQVGDTIRVVFKNNAKFPATVHPHGVLYTKSSEGANYNDGSTGADKADDAVPPGGTHTYVWAVPERAGPAEHEGSSTLWMYHSHADEVRDVESGLMGPIIITRRGMARPDGSPIDVDREIVAGFMETDENQSWYIADNIRTYATTPDKVSVVTGPFFLTWARSTPLLYDKYFRETINGYSYGHTPGLTMKVGQRVRWYLMSGPGFEIHSVHWHGNVVTVNHMRTDVTPVLTMGMVVADMVPDNPGKWLLHCHVHYHMRMGMQAFYVVEPAEPGAKQTRNRVQPKQVQGEKHTH
jgi:FtsP/CotA-like multicopper oxidase with cupredoxin domain